MGVKVEMANHSPLRFIQHVCVCVCVCTRERERYIERDRQVLAEEQQETGMQQ